MSVLAYIELSGGKIKKDVLQAVCLGYDMASGMGGSLSAVAVGDADAGELEKLGQYGVTKVYKVSGPDYAMFADRAYTNAVNAAVEASGASVVVMSHGYNGKAIAPRLSVKMDAALFSAVTALPAQNGGGWSGTSLANSGKGIHAYSTAHSKLVVTVRGNSYKMAENAGSAAIEDLNVSADVKGAVSTSIEKATSKISITEADSVVSGGRGFKGPENWGILEELATELNAGTACSKPVSDMDWRPHHEHVGQTGIQIGPNLYIAIGISGAIQHLAGVNTSKNIVVINKDPEAPFFKIADYGIVGDLFDVVPKLTEAVKKLKASS